MDNPNYSTWNDLAQVCVHVAFRRQHTVLLHEVNVSKQLQLLLCIYQQCLIHAPLIGTININIIAVSFLIFQEKRLQMLEAHLFLWCSFSFNCCTHSVLFGTD